MFFEVYLPFAMGIGFGLLLKEAIKIAKECREIEKEIKKIKGKSPF